MPLQGLRVLDLCQHAGALASRLLADLGAEVIRIESLAGGVGSTSAPGHREEGLAHLYANANKTCFVLEEESEEERLRIVSLVESADVIFDDRTISLGAAVDEPERLATRRPEAIVVRVSPFGATGPRAHWVGSDLIATARGGMTFVNGEEAEPPLVPYGLAAHGATGLVGAVAALLALRARERSGSGVSVDLSMVEAVAGTVEHVTGLYRQSGEIQSRQGTLHWSRTFRVGRARDGFVLMTHLGDWTTLSHWAAGECPAVADLTDSRWDDVAERKEHAGWIFDRLDEWIADHSVDEICEGAALRRLPFGAVRPPESLATDEQLRARSFATSLDLASQKVSLPGPLGRFSACPAPRRRAPKVDGAADWSCREVDHKEPTVPTALGGGARPLDGVTVLDFTWVVAGPVATRILADHGARVVKVEPRNAGDFGTRRGGLSGNLNRGKESIVIDLATEAGRGLARDLAVRADVVIDNFSARVMQAWSLDYDSLRKRRADAIAVRLTGFGLDGPRRDGVSYGPTLQALVGYPYLMRTPSGLPAGWGYSWSDMVAGWTGALATLAALAHRGRTGEGQRVDVSQFETLTALMGPGVLDLLAGRVVEGVGNASQEGRRVPHGIFRCAPERRPQGMVDDERWLALSIEDNAAWLRLVDVLAQDGENWAGDASLRDLAGREAQRSRIEIALGDWTRRRRAEDLEERLQDHAVAAGLVANGADMIRDPQLVGRRYFERVSDSQGEFHEFDGIPFRTSSLPGRITAPGPLRAEHTAGILSQWLGLSAQEIEALRERGIIE